jgi:site-specific recombinase XerD
LAAVRLLFDSLMMRGVVEYNPAARAKPPRLVRESSHTPVFEEAEIVTFLDSITANSLKDIRDKALFCVLRVTEYMNSGGTIEIAQRIAGHTSSSTTRIYDRSGDQLTFQEIERVQIGKKQKI